MGIKAFIRENRYRCIVIWERLNGLDFSKQMNNAEIGIGLDDGNYFSSSAYFKEVKTVLNDLRLNQDDSIFDFGFGKGATMALFNKYPFKKIGGIELSNSLVTIANKNLSLLGIQHAELINGNAVSYENLDDYNHFYFYNPFPKNVMTSVIRNIEQSTLRKPRIVKIIYCNPALHLDIISSNAFFLEKRYGSETSWAIINVYKNNVN